MVFRTILSLNICIIIMRALSRHRTYSLLLMGNARTRTTACFPIIAVNGSIHVCNDNEEERKSYNDKMGYIVASIPCICSNNSLFLQRAQIPFPKKTTLCICCCYCCRCCHCYLLASSDSMRVITLLQSTFKCLLWMFLMLCTSCLSACASDACARCTIFVVAFVCKESNEIFHFLWQRESQLPVNICLSSQHITAMDVCASEDRVWNENKNQFTREREIAKVARLTEDIPLSDPFYRYSALLFL